MKDIKKIVDDFVSTLFDGVVDKAGVPYISHCRFVAEMAEKTAKDLEIFTDDEILDIYLSGLCHDVLEDTDTSESDLEKLIGKRAVKVVKLCSHPSTKFDYNKYIGEILKDKMASVVKFSDSTHNSMISRFPESEWTERRKFKCQRYAERAKLLITSLTK